jgi:hypothetical protein
MFVSLLLILCLSANKVEVKIFELKIVYIDNIMVESVGLIIFGTYKFEEFSIGNEFDIFVTKNNNELVADGIEKLELDNLTFVKHITVKTTEATLTGKLLTPSKQIIIVRKQPIQRTEFDFTGRTIATYDAQNNQTLYFHDSLGRQIAVVQPPAGEDNMRLARESLYDLAGNVYCKCCSAF